MSEGDNKPKTRARKQSGGATQALAGAPAKGAGTPARITFSADDSGRVKAAVQANGEREFAAMFGATDPAFADTALHDLVGLAGMTNSGTGPIDGSVVNGLLALVADIKPEGELEGAIALQLAGFHRLSMACLARAANPKATLEGRNQNLTSANKCARTFAALLEQLNRHRGKVTTQRVVVENVTVEAGGQAVVGAVMGAGQRQNSKEQRHGNEGTGDSDAHAGSCVASLLGADASRDALPAGGGEGPTALPDAWMCTGERSAEGQPQCLQARALQRSGDRDASVDASDARPRARSARLNEGGA